MQARQHELADAHGLRDRVDVPGRGLGQPHADLQHAPAGLAEEVAAEAEGGHTGDLEVRLWWEDVAPLVEGGIGDEADGGSVIVLRLGPAVGAELVEARAGVVVEGAELAQLAGRCEGAQARGRLQTEATTHDPGAVLEDQ